MSITSTQTQTKIEFTDKHHARTWFKDKYNSTELMFFGNRVLNAAEFKHPGPQKLITEAFNTDITDDYIEQSHSKYADQLIHEMTVGYLPESKLAKNEMKRLHNEHHPNGLSKEEEEIHNWLDKTIDLKQPLLPQVKKMTNKQFLAFVKRPRQLPGDSYDGIQLWEDPLKDEESKCDYELNLMVMLPISVACTVYATYSASSWNMALLNFVVFYVIAGVCLMWTFTEYYLHRFSRHGEHFLDPEGKDDGETLVDLFSGHLSHHVFMNQARRIVISLKTYFQYMGVAWVTTQFLVPAPILYMFFGGWILGSLLYDGMHLSFHFNWNIPTTYYQNLKDAHMRHHFRDTSKEYGVITPLWDHVCGTERQSSIKQE